MFDKSGGLGGFGAWEVFENHDCFAGDHAMTKPLGGSVEAAMRLCASKGFGGFVVHRNEVHFRRQNRIELREKKIR